MALTVGEYLYNKLVPGAKVYMNVGEIEVLHATVANPSKKSTQPLYMDSHLDLSTQRMSIALFNVDPSTGNKAAESYATASVRFETDVGKWTTEWDRMTHLVLGRIEALERMATERQASQLSKALSYALFGNVVDYADHYRGMERVVMHDHEAFADIKLIPDRRGIWHTPPHWIDGVSHLAGLIMNGSAASNTRDFFFVTPGYGSFRLLEKLDPTVQYQSYVRMFELPEANMYGGDLYILQDKKIVGMVGEFKFRRVPRLLMDRFFSADAAAKTSVSTTGSSTKAAPAAKAPTPAPAPAKPASAPLPNGQPQSSSSPPSAPQQPKPAEPATNGVKSPAEEQPSKADAAAPNGTAPEPEVSGVIGQALQLIAKESGQGVEDLTPDATFVQLGVDSLMSLVLSEKFRAELGLEVKSSLFLECPTIGEMTEWLDQYC